MSNIVSTITSKWQVTLPEDVRKELPFKIGQRIVWQVEGDKIIGRRMPTISELSGCLKSADKATDEKDFEKAFGAAAVARHERISKQKS
jgi:bifunctional DNA-binding transcriptional regulator/antitoxin component of YhaV-PrlF toxin-antitoxin module